MNIEFSQASDLGVAQQFSAIVAEAAKRGPAPEVLAAHRAGHGHDCDAARGAEGRWIAGRTYGSQGHFAMSAVITPTYSGTFKLADRQNYADIFNATYGGEKAREKVTCTYIIKCEPTGHVYVGATESFYYRWKSHLNALRRGDHSNDQLQALYNEHGEDAFTISIADHVYTTNGLIEREENTANRFTLDKLLNYRVGNRIREGWMPFMNEGKNKGSYKPSFKRGPQGKLRWFDYTSRKGLNHA